MHTRGIDLCTQCHRYIHSIYSEKELGRKYNTLEALLADQKIAKYVAWAKKQR